MAKGNKAGDLLYDFFNQSPALKQGWQQLKCREVWHEVTHHRFKKYTDEITLKNKVLYIKINAAPLRAELVIRKDEIAKQLREKLPADVFSKVVFC